VTDHCDISQESLTDIISNADKSVEDIENHKNVNSRLHLLTGVELGQPHHIPEESARLLARHSYDFVLASVHNLRNREDFYYMDFSREAIDVRDILRLYFDELLEITAWGNFDSLAHLTYPLRYITGKYGITVSLKSFEEQITHVLERLAQTGKALEINTSGLRKPGGTLMPPEQILHRFYEVGGQLITVGSDSHKPRDIGSGIQYALATAEKCGFRYYAVYKNRKPEMIQI